MCEKKKIFKFALDFIKDTLVVLLNNRNELPHFWFHETLFKPFENILMSGKLSDIDQDQASIELLYHCVILTQVLDQAMYL
jgi:hypothetical protein